MPLSTARTAARAAVQSTSPREQTVTPVLRSRPRQPRQVGSEGCEAAAVPPPRRGVAAAATWAVGGLGGMAAAVDRGIAGGAVLEEDIAGIMGRLVIVAVAEFAPDVLGAWGEPTMPSSSAASEWMSIS